MPGSGQYNPHKEVKKLKLQPQWDNPKDWIAKHKTLNKGTSKAKGPDMGTYKPHPVTYKTFGQDLEKYTQKKRPKSATDGKMFGTQSRFENSKSIKTKPGT